MESPQREHRKTSSGLSAAMIPLSCLHSMNLDVMDIHPDIKLWSVINIYRLLYGRKGIASFTAA
jgi:hypothetical protein